MGHIAHRGVILLHSCLLVLPRLLEIDLLLLKKQLVALEGGVVADRGNSLPVPIAALQAVAVLPVSRLRNVDGPWIVISVTHGERLEGTIRGVDLAGLWYLADVVLLWK